MPELSPIIIYVQSSDDPQDSCIAFVTMIETLGIGNLGLDAQHLKRRIPVA
jgi:hypothetical protein